MAITGPPGFQYHSKKVRMELVFWRSLGPELSLDTAIALQKAGLSKATRRAGGCARPSSLSRSAVPACPAMHAAHEGERKGAAGG